MVSLRNAGLFAVLSFLWGTAFVGISAGLEYIPPVLFAAFRYDIAGLVMLLYAVVVADTWRPSSQADWITVLVGAILVIALYNVFLFIGQRDVTSGVAAILIAMNPILATGFSRLLLSDERLSPVRTVGLLVGFVGVGLVVTPDPSSVSETDLVASGFVLLAAVCVALGSVLMQRQDSEISTESTVAWSCALGAVILHLISLGLPTESLGQIQATSTAVFSVVYLSVFASGVGYLIYFDLLGRLGAIEINLVSYVAPVFATVFGWLLLNESITPEAIFGFLLITGGFVLMKYEAFAAQFRRLRLS